MNAQTLLSALTDLDSDLILDAKPSAPAVHRPRRLMTLIIAAAIVLSLAACGAAVQSIGYDLIFEFFQNGSTKGMTENQVAYLEENTREVGLSQTVDGYTITIDSAITDGQDVYIAMSITAPEGVILDGDDYSFRKGIDLIQGDFVCGDFCLGFSLEDTLTDGVLHATYSGYDIFPDSSPWTLQIGSLESYYNDGSNGYWIRPTLVDDPWNFEITFEPCTDVLELVTDPIVTTVDNGTGQIQITSLQLRALSLSITFDYLTDHNPELSCRMDELILVTKDGTQIKLSAQRGGWDGIMSFRANAPILFAEADYLLFPDGTQVSIPQA